LNFIQHSITLEPFNVHLSNLEGVLRSMVGTFEHNRRSATPNPRWPPFAILDLNYNCITLEPFNIDTPNMACML